MTLLPCVCKRDKQNRQRGTVEEQREEDSQVGSMAVGYDLGVPMWDLSFKPCSHLRKIIVCPGNSG